MKKIYYLYVAMITAICCVSCNNEWESEQYVQMAAFTTELNSSGVAPAYIRFNPGGTVRYKLPIVISGSTNNTRNRTIHFAVDRDTLAILNWERYGDRKELYYKGIYEYPEYFSFPETIEIPAGESTAVLPIDFTLGGLNGANPLDLSDKWILPVTIVDDESYDYVSNPRKHYRKALLNITPFNDYSGTYSGTQCKIFLNGNKDQAFTMTEHKAYVVDDKTLFVYAGLRDVEYLDRKNYKVFIEFTDERIDLQKKKLRIWSDNDDSVNGNAFKVGAEQAYYTTDWEFDVTKPYLKHVYITLYLSYSFEDYTTSPGVRLKYDVEGTLSMQRDLNTLIPDEDQQIQW